MTDSTSQANHGTINDSTAGAGKVDGALNSVNGQIHASGPGNIVTSNVLTMSVWFKTSEINTYRALLSIRGTSDVDAMELFVYGAGDANANLFGGNHDNRALSAAGSVVANTWTLAHLVSDGTTTQLYVNGVPSGTPGTTHFSTFSPLLKFAARVEGEGYGLNGALDEVRIAAGALSADWIKTEFNNQNNPATFYSVGAAQ